MATINKNTPFDFTDKNTPIGAVDKNTPIGATEETPQEDNSVNANGEITDETTGGSEETGA